MKFTTCAQARIFATLERIRTGIRHIVEPTRYWSMQNWRYNQCFAVIIAPQEK